MNTPRPSWPSLTLILASIPILFIFLAAILAYVSEVTTRDGVYDVTFENAAFFGGLYLAIPCGLTAIIAGASARSRGLITKKAAATGIVIGSLGILSRAGRLGLVRHGFGVHVLGFASTPSFAPRLYAIIFPQKGVLYAAKNCKSSGGRPS